MKIMTAWTSHVALATLGYVASGPLMASGFAYLGNACAVDEFLLQCDIVARPAFDPISYGLIALSVIITLAGVHFTSRDRPFYLPVLFFSLLILSAITWDATVTRYVQNAEKLANDTLNTLRFAIWASHILFATITRKLDFSLVSMALSNLISCIGVALAGILFAAISANVMGATRLLMLFLLFSLIGFGIHLMSIATLTAHGKMREAQ